MFRQTKVGFYLAGILDLCGREIAGWAMGERMTKELVIKCLNRRGNPKGVLLHSDYTEENTMPKNSDILYCC